MRIAVIAAFATVACVAGAVACSAPPVSVSSTIAVSHDDKTLFVTSWDDDALVQIDATSLAEVKRVQVAKGPSHVVIEDDAHVAWITAELDTAIGRVDLATMHVQRVDVPCGGTGDVVLDVQHTRVIVACPNDDRVLLVDEASLNVARTIDVDGRPTALAVRGNDLYVATSKPPAQLVHISLDNLSVVDTQELAHEPAHEAEQAASIAFVDDTPVVAYTVVDNDDRTLPVDEGGYGSVVDGAPRIEPRLSACLEHPAVFDGGARVLSGPSALVVDPSTNAAFLAGQFTDSIVALDCNANASLGTLRTGRGPRGLALSHDGQTLFVDVGFDLAVDRVAASKLRASSSVVQPDAAKARDLGASRLSDAARRGRAIFNDAVNTHMTPSGVVTCASCHPGGGEDGVTWFFHTPNITARVRRTQNAWGARTELAPFHWDGEFTDAAKLAQSTTQELLGGDALLIAFDDVAAYMAEIPMPPPKPPENAALVAKGRALFFDAGVGCATCHAGALFADGKRHDVVAHTGDAAVDIEGGADTPSLVGIRARAPFLHDGTARTLLQRVANNPSDAHGKTSQLAPADLNALVAFLESL